MKKKRLTKKKTPKSNKFLKLKEKSRTLECMAFLLFQVCNFVIIKAMSSFEHPLGQESDLEITNQMQVNLAERFYGTESNDTLVIWISNYSPKFRDIINENPDLIKEYKSSSDSTLSKIEEILYKKEPNK